MPNRRDFLRTIGGTAAGAFVMTRLGFKDVAVYTASLQEWAADPDAPLTTD